MRSALQLVLLLGRIVYQWMPMCMCIQLECVLHLQLCWHRTEAREHAIFMASGLSSSKITTLCLNMWAASVRALQPI